MATCFIKSSVLIQKRRAFYTHGQALAPNRDNFQLAVLGQVELPREGRFSAHFGVQDSCICCIVTLAQGLLLSATELLIELGSFQTVSVGICSAYDQHGAALPHCRGLPGSCDVHIGSRGKTSVSRVQFVTF
jgi:hypothetical protein